MYDNYAVVGDFCTMFETELQVCADYSDAVDWLHRYISRGDWGGYASITVINAETRTVQFTAFRDEY